MPKEYAEGIFVFPNDAETGADALESLALDDAILELGLTHHAVRLSPRSLAFLILKLPGSTAPTVATATFWNDA